MVGGATGRQQRHDAVDHHFFVEHFPQRHPLVAIAGHAGDLARGGGGQRVPQRGIRMHKRGARQLHAHKLNHHLVGVRRPVESTGSRRVVRGSFRLQQGHTIHFTFRVQLANADLLFISQAAGHWTGGNKDRRQMAERECRHGQARNNFIAHPEVQRAVEHVMRQTDSGGHGDHFAAQQ